MPLVAIAVKVFQKTRMFGFFFQKQILFEIREKPFKRHIPSKQFDCQKRELILSHKLESLILQRLKRTKATKWNLLPQWKQWRLERQLANSKKASKTLGKVARLDKNLKEFFLSFTRDEALGDKGLLVLAHGLKGLKGLQAITLKVEDSHQTTDRGSHYLMKGLTRLCLLKSFLLDLS